MNENNKLENRLTSLETTQKFILAELKSIKDNHLVSIYKKVDTIERSLNGRPSWFVSILLTGMTSIIVALIMFSVTK